MNDLDDKSIQTITNTKNLLSSYLEDIWSNITSSEGFGSSSCPASPSEYGSFSDASFFITGTIPCAQLSVIGESGSKMINDSCEKSLLFKVR